MQKLLLYILGWQSEPGISLFNMISNLSSQPLDDQLSYFSSQQSNKITDDIFDRDQFINISSTSFTNYTQFLLKDDSNIIDNDYLQLQAEYQKISQSYNISVGNWSSQNMLKANKDPQQMSIIERYFSQQNGYASLLINKIKFEKTTNQSDTFQQLQIVNQIKKYYYQMINQLGNSKTNVFNFYTFVIIDGSYANKMALIQLRYPFKIDEPEEGTVNLYSSQNITSSIIIVDDYQPQEVQSCQLDVEFSLFNYNIKKQSQMYTLRKSASDENNQKCFGQSDFQFTFKLNNVNDMYFDDYLYKIRNFSAYACTIMIFLIYYSINEADRFANIYSIRIRSLEQHGGNSISYASQFSLLTNVMIFWINFGIIMIYFKLSVIQLGIGKKFMLPLILQFIIFFFYCHRILIYQLRIISMDSFHDFEQQNSWAQTKQLLIYIFSFASVIYTQQFYMSPFFISLVIGSIWIPQIYRNSIKGIRGVPNLEYSIWQSIHILYIPISIYGFDQNIILNKPKYVFVSILCIWMIAQLLSIKIQQTNPRFLIPKKYRERLAGSNYYRYERNFQDDSLRPSNSLLSDQPQEPLEQQNQGQQQDYQNDFEQQVEKIYQRLTKMKELECPICKIAMGKDANDESQDINEFMMTPCGHRFHKKCLLDWMSRKHECPNCRTNLPIYQDLD